MLKTISSVSGGKTSAYMALNYPTDFYVFSVVVINHEPSQPKDKGLLRECKNRIPGFVASHEADSTLEVVLKLEQEIGQEIIWVAADFPLEDFVNGHTDLPGYRSNSSRLFNRRTRFCTVQQKIFPIAKYCYSQISGDDPVLMNLGFRFDEKARVTRWKCSNDKIKMPVSCPILKGNWRYLDYEWRITQFPLYRDRITKPNVIDFWDKRGWSFPEISNCRFCPFHSDLQLQQQKLMHQENLNWWLELESQTGQTFGDRSLEDRLRQPLLNIFDLPCHCTD